VTGGFLARVGFGALPFLLPLFLQLGFHYTPVQSGLITFLTAVGAISMKLLVAPILRRFGFRNVLVWNCVISAAFLAACAMFTARTPMIVMMLVLLIGGFFRSIAFTCIGTIAYAEVDAPRMSSATSLVAALQQLSISTGVAIGALTVETASRLNHSSTFSAADFPPAFLVVSAISLSAVVVFWRLPRDAGAILANRAPAPKIRQG
jgi:MFS family permease